MAQHYRFNTALRPVVTASVACLALLASPLACQSDEEDSPDDAAATEADSPGPVDVPARDADRTAASTSNTRPNAASADAEQSPNPATPASTPNASAAAGAASDPDAPPPAPAQTFESCLLSEGSYGTNCDSIYVTMKQLSPARCVQLTIDNCDAYSRQGLPVDVPPMWRLASGTISSNLNECELGVFYPESTIAGDASGSISWSIVARQPAEIVLDVTLEPSSSAADTTSVVVATAEPLNPITCED